MTSEWNKKIVKNIHKLNCILHNYICLLNFFISGRIKTQKYKKSARAHNFSEFLVSQNCTAAACTKTLRISSIQEQI
jgi:hypothetical protein